MAGLLNNFEMVANYSSGPVVIETTTTLSTPYSYSPPFTEADVIVTSVLLIAFLVFGVVANVVTICVIITSKNLRSIFYCFILSLCFADVVSSLVSWINLYRRTWGFDDFDLPNFFCVVYWGVDIWTSYVTSLHIVSFSILRLVGIMTPHNLGKITVKYGKIWIALIWIVTFFCGGIPMGLFSGSHKKDRTASTPDSKWPMCTQLPQWLKEYGIYTRVAYAIFFYIPIICTVVISLAIGIYMVKKARSVSQHVSTASAMKRRRKDRKAILQLALIVGSYLLGYVPFTAFEFYTFQQSNSTEHNLRFDWRFGTIQYLCLRFSECLNPVFYNLASKTMRIETKEFLIKLLTCGWCRKKDDPYSTKGTLTVTGLNTVT